LLEAGFDTITPNMPLNISSWVWEYLVAKNMHSNYINNTASSVLCYHPGYTLVEKLQTIIRKYRNRSIADNSNNANFMWDGSFKGVIQNPQVFVYTIKTTFIDGYMRNDYKGSVTLIR
jgi:hypothetical protein